MARLKLLASGVCATDLHIHDGILGRDPSGTGQIIGHEFVGIIDGISTQDSRATGLRLGDRVIACIAQPCGECPLCRSGDSANCIHMGATNEGNPAEAPYFHGGYAEYNFSPVNSLVRITEDIDSLVAATFACAGPTSLHAFKLASRANIDLTGVNLAVVQGLGPVGMFSALYLATLGVRVITITGRKVVTREEIAKGYGVSECLALSEGGAEAVAERIMRLTEGLGADLCIEASGNPTAFAEGFTYLRNRGVYLVPGQYSISGGVSVSPEIITFKALRILGSSQYGLDDIRSYLDFLERNPELAETILRMVTTYPVSRVNDAYADIRAGKNIKTILVGG